MEQKPFGRRVGFAPRPAQTRPATGAVVAPAAAAIDTPSIRQAASPPSASADDELRDWKRARRRSYRIPWRQLSLMASLCFGVAAFVLPDTVSNTLNWVLYALMIASFVAGIRRRRESA